MPSPPPAQHRSHHRKKPHHHAHHHYRHDHRSTSLPRREKSVTFEDASVWSGNEKLGEIPRARLDRLWPETVDSRSRRSPPGAWRSSFSESESEGEKAKKGYVERRAKRRSWSFGGLESSLRLRPSPTPGRARGRSGQRDFLYRLDRDGQGNEVERVRGVYSPDWRADTLRRGGYETAKEVSRGRPVEREMERDTSTTRELRARGRRRDSDIRPSESVSCQLEPPSRRPPEIFAQPGYRRAKMRTVSNDDYLLARGANPRTGMISPSVWTPTGSSRGTPSPGPAYPDLSPGGRKQRRSDRGSCDHKWRMRGEEWISLGVDQATPGASPPPERKEHRQRQGQQQSHSHSLRSSAAIRQRVYLQQMTPSPTRRSQTVPLKELEDKFVVNMPSAREPSPPQMTPSMIKEYQAGFQRISGQGGAMVDPTVLPKPSADQQTLAMVRNEGRTPMGKGAQSRNKSSLILITEKSSTHSKDNNRREIKRKPVGSPISANSPTQTPAAGLSSETVVRGKSQEPEVVDQERASSEPTPRNTREEKQTPSWYSPEEVRSGVHERVSEARERIRAQSQTPFLGRGVGSVKDSKADCQNSTQGHPLFETTMNAFRFLSPLYSKMKEPVSTGDAEELDLKDNQGGEVETGGLIEERCSHCRPRTQIQNPAMRAQYGCCRGWIIDPTDKGRTKSQQPSGHKTEESGRKNAHIITTSIIPTSIPITTSSPTRIAQSRGQCHHESETIVRRPRPKPQGADVAAAVPQASPQETPPSPGGGRSWFMPPKVDLLGGWDVVGTGKPVTMGVKGGLGGGRVPRALVPTEGTVEKCRHKCQIREGGYTTSAHAGAAREGIVRRKGNGGGLIPINGLGEEEVGKGICCDCECGSCGGRGLRVQAIENVMGRVRKVMVRQKEGEIAELETPIGSYEEESTSESREERWNDTDDTLVPRPLEVKIQRKDEKDSGSSGGLGQEEDESSSFVTSSDEDIIPRELDIRLSSLLALILHIGTVLVKYDAFDRGRHLLHRLAAMAVHVFQTAVQLHDMFLLPRYYHPKQKGRRASKGSKEKERLAIVKVTRDCAVAGGELLVLVCVAVLVGRVGLTMMGCLKWLGWVGGWLGWFLKGLLSS